MALEPGSKLGPYEIVALLGRGGMGEVYRARDPKLPRDVAIKVLSADFARDVDRITRLHREARTLATLTHPFIAQIHGLEDSSGTPALVLELVDGPTLADRLLSGPLPIREALEIGRQIAEAIEAAHEKNVIHRDLKPANVKVRPDGTVKVLDFGLAKAIEGNVDAQDVEPTRTAGTEAGVVLGTAAYMSPEQARGQAVDRRTDVWAFGCVLFEMLTGRRAFEGDTVSDTLANVLTREPDWRLLPAETSPRVTRLIRRCLEKDLRRRLRDVGDIRIELEDLAVPSTDPEAKSAVPLHVSRRAVIGALGGAVAGAVATGAFMIGRRGDGLPRGVMRFPIPLDEGDSIVSSLLTRVALSPDGSRIACNVARAGLSTSGVRPGAPASTMLLRSVGELGWKPAADYSGSPFFSPDGQWLGIMQATGQQRLTKVALSGGAPIVVSSYADSQPGGATWAPDNNIYFVSSTPGGARA